MNVSVILTVVGPDKPGLVDEVAKIIKDHDGNWLESRLAHLGGQFAGMLQADVPAEKQEALKEALNQLEGLAVHVADTGSKVPPEGDVLLFEVLGQDRPGIVSEVAHLLSELKVNVEELSTNVEAAAIAGGNLFSAVITAGLPERLSADELIAKLEALSDDMQVSILEQ